MSARMPRSIAVPRSKLYERLIQIVDREGTRDAYRLEVDLMPMVLEMRRRGIRIDQARPSRRAISCCRNATSR